MRRLRFSPSGGDYNGETRPALAPTFSAGGRGSASFKSGVEAWAGQTGEVAELGPTPEVHPSPGALSIFSLKVLAPGQPGSASKLTNKDAGLLSRGRSHRDGAEFRTCPLLGNEWGACVKRGFRKPNSWAPRDPGACPAAASVSYPPSGLI